MLNRSASLAMSTSVLKALPCKLYIKRHSPSILYITTFLSSESLIKLNYPIMVLGIVLSRPRYKIMNCVIFCPYVCLKLCFYSTVLVIDVYRLHDNMSVCLHMLLSSTKKLILYHEIIFFDLVLVQNYFRCVFLFYQMVLNPYYQHYRPVKRSGQTV